MSTRHLFLHSMLQDKLCLFIILESFFSSYLCHQLSSVTVCHISNTSIQLLILESF